TLNVTIPETARMTPPLVMWDPGEKAGPKTVMVEALPGQPMQVVKVKTSAPEFEAKIETVEENAKYRIVVTPSGTAKEAFAMLDIETRVADGVKTLRALAQVRAVERAAKAPQASQR